MSRCLRACAVGLASFLAACGGGEPEAPTPSPAQPNIVLVIADDLAARDLGFMGSPNVETPRLDALAQASTVLPNGWVTASVCVPSIRSLLTGLEPLQWSLRMQALADRQGVYAKRLEQTRVLPTLPRQLAQAGYVSFQGGKLWEASHAIAGFDEGTVEDFDVRRKDGRRDAVEIPLGRETLAPLLSFLDARAADDRPFFVWFAPKLPHYPFDATREFTSRYRGRGFSKLAVGYYANITRLDAVVGDVLDALAARGQAENTLVVFLSDNGWDQPPSSDPEQHPPDVWDGPHGKRSMYDVGFRTPVLLHWPGVIEGDAVHPWLVSTLDVVVTLLDYAGAPHPPGLTGRSLRPALEGRTAWEREAVVGGMVRPRRGRPPEGDPARERWKTEPGAWFVRTPRWHYIARPFVGAEELYDVERDPGEQSDLARDEPALLVSFREQVAAFQREMEADAQSFAAQDPRRERPPAR